MGVTTISETFVFFGNCQILDSKVDALKNGFIGYTYRVVKEKLSNGSEANIHVFHNVNKRVTIRAYRIDFEYGHNSPQCDFSGFTSFVVDAIQIISAVADLRAHRVGYNNVEFVEDVKGKIKSATDKLFNFPRVFGSNAAEIKIRLNHKTKIDGEIYNSVITIEDGSVTDNNTKVESSAMFINKDINTLIDNNNVRFDLLDSVDYICNMYRESNNHTSKLLKKLGVR